jgi:hypothetical protein
LISVCRSLRVSIDIPTNIVDGAYQTASSLYRLNYGEWPGRDFFPYLGIGPTFILYPLFKLAGTNISASVFSSYFVVSILRIGSIWLVAFISSNKNKVLIASISSSLFLFLSFFTSQISSFFSPGNSLRPIRGFLPYLIALCLYLIITTKIKLIKKYDFCLIGIVAGFCILWSNDFALSTAFFTLIFFFGYKFKDKKLTLRILLFTICTTLLSATFLLYICTQGHMLEMLSYNFIDVRNDQYWYFGDWREPKKIFHVLEVLPKILLRLPVVLPTSFILLVFVIKIKIIKSINYLETYLISFILGLLFSGGAIASVGGHYEGGYFTEYSFFWLIFSMCFLVELALLLINYLNRKNQPNTKKILVNSIIISTFLLFLLLGLQMNRYFSNLNSAKMDNNKFYVGELGGYLPIAYKQHIEMASQFSNDEVIEEYWGLWSAFNRNHTPLPVDSVIHALGNTRYKYLSVLEQFPKRIITITNSSAPQWQPWNFSANYWFYKVLVENYEPMQTSPSTLVWTKTITKKRSEVECKINKSGENFSLINVISGYYEVTINADISLKGRSLSLIKNNINYALDAKGYLSLDPTKTSFTFPVHVSETNANLFDVEFSQPNKNIGNVFNISSCKAYTIPILHEQVTPMRPVQFSE